MTFAVPFWLFIGLAVCATLAWLYHRFDVRQRAALSTFASSHLLGQLTASFSTRRRMLKRVLYVAAVACVFTALAQPQWGFRWEEAKRKGIDILFAVDTSKSMLAQDVKPNRITRAKLAVSDLVGNLDGDRVGLIAFAGDAFLQSPLTLDYDAFRQSLDALDVGIIPRGGTDVASAISEAQAAFGSDTNNQKILVLITDGEDLEDKGIDAAKAAAKSGLKVYTIGVGSTTGELIPVPDENGGTNFIKDDAGNYVKSHLDESTLKQIAEATGALYAPLGQQGQGLETVYQHALAPLPKQELASRLNKVMIERFQWPLALGIVLLVAEMFIGTRKGSGRKRKFAPVPASKPRVKIHRAPALEPVGIALVALCVAAVSAHASPQSAESAYKKGDYASAETQYQQAAASNPKLAALPYNEGTAAYKAGQYDKALPAFQKTLETDKLDLQQQAYYNLGNTQYRLGQQTEKAKPQDTIKTWQGAVASYDAALKLKADDADAKFNHDLVQKKLDQLQKQQQQKQDQQNKDQQSKDQQSKDQSSKDQENKDQKDQQSKDQQNQPPKPDKKDQNGQPKSDDQQPGNEPPKPSPSGQEKQPTQLAKNDQKPQPTPGEAQPSPSPQPGQDQDQPEPPGQPGQMSPQEAKSLLDSLKKDEHALPATPDARAAGQPKQDQPLKTGKLMKRIFLTLCAVSVALAASVASAAEVTATLDPAQVAFGESAELTVTVNGSSTAAPNVPDVAGLEIEHIGQSTQIQIVNGAMSASSVYTYQVTPQRSGTFTIPAIQAGGARSRPLTLSASGNGTNPNPPARNQQSSRGSVLPSPNVPMPQASANATAPADARYGFIQLVVPKREFYVGELLPVEVNAFVPAGMQATVNGLPTLSSEAFTLNPLGPKPDQDERVVNGRDYTVLTWHSALTAVKTGDFELTMQMPVTVVVRDQPQRRQRGNSNDPFEGMLSDPFFDNAFAGVIGHKKEVTLGSEPDVLTVQALPTANRPVGFAGAVGNFQVRATASPTNATAGDPLTLRLEVSGTGNFDRLTSDVLASASRWKTYPAKNTFAPDDSAGYKGTKTFEQVVMAKDASVKEIPVLRLSFFDPETKRYETRTTAPIPVQITGAPANLAAANVPAAAAPNTPPAPAAPDLVPNKVEPGRFVATLRPVFTDPWFVGAQGLPLCALAGGLLFLRRQRRFAADPRLARASAAERAVHSQIDAMDRAARQHDSAAFFLAARGALQQRLGERWSARPETITLTEINARLNGAGDAIRPVFEMADRISYSGQEFGDADYQQWKTTVLTQLKDLEQHS